jgi:membrane protein
VQASGGMRPLWRLGLRVGRRAAGADVKVLAGGVALFLLLGLLPSMTAVVSIYALLADPLRIESELGDLDRVLPDPVFDLLVEQLERAAGRSGDELGLALAGSLLLALLASRSGADALLKAIHRIDGNPPRWRGWRHVLLTGTIAVGALVGAVTVLATVVALPSVTAELAPSRYGLVAALRWPALLGFGVVSLSVLFWLGAPHQHWRDVLPGALVATVLAALASFGVSLYVNGWASYQTLYGAFGGAMVIILWFYVTSLAVLIGAAVNAERATPS